ncbi:ATP-binding cassette domain-containing protein [Streptomyces sp. NPDC097619]|uniref:ATP-binding cassette domain-containing protein n=1 Tax=Streptomyces sp. NPDC097619 TaxID=3157228 RepID=UPI00332715A1
MDIPHGAAVRARDFGLKGPRGWAFRSVDLDAEPGTLIAVEGPSGSGRTCLLLALTGRMKPTEGHAEVGRFRLPKKMAAVRRIAGLGPVPGVTDLDASLTVGEHLRERALLQGRYDAPVRGLFRSPAERSRQVAARVDEALAAVGLDPAALPRGPRTPVREVERLDELRLSLALALIGRPRLLALDDTDLKLSDPERAEAWALLRSLADRGTTVLAVCSEAPEGALVVRTGPAARPETVATAAAVPAAEEPPKVLLPKRVRKARATAAAGGKPEGAVGTASADGAVATEEDRPGGGPGRAGSAEDAERPEETDGTGTTETARNTEHDDDTADTADTADVTDTADASDTANPGESGAAERADGAEKAGTAGKGAGDALA